MSLIRKKLGYLATIKGVENVKGREVTIYNQPKPFNELYMPLQSSNVFEAFGLNDKETLVMYVSTNLWSGKIHKEDRAYLINDETSEDEVKQMVKKATNTCSNANYKVSYVGVQNLKLKVTFEKIK